MSTILTGNDMVEFAIGKINTPYVYGAKIQEGPLTQNKVDTMHRMYPTIVNDAYLRKIVAKKLVGQVCVDCSGLIAGYTGKIIGSSQMYSSAKKKMDFKNFNSFAKGVVLWRSGHVGIYAGLNSKGVPYCIEAKGIDYGTVATPVKATDKWKYGLTFDYIQYDYEEKLSGITHQRNPYTEPTSIVKKGTKGEPARWVQFELVEAGFGDEFEWNGKTYKGVKIDGDIGEISDAAIRAFQSSSKIVVDGEVGKKTRAALHLDDMIAA